ncbi:WD40 repeat domain-containing protein [Hymenobacter canadensis]|uniref:WD40 repeat domain-containing protein n=1 Tax=Hymenobacter canadensis TaxID=2999067 RepID=A0ABY7LL15_9BACT|nr:cytochrome D1 domain-containing protein [Hymenobacter canadensis]WBA40284.1 WD40 repeat domain-containing protein [Hymenobacter canadensis]
MPFLHRPQAHKLTALTGHLDCVYTLAGTPGSDTFYSAGADGLVAAWHAAEDAQDGELVAKVENSVYTLLHLPKLDLLLIGHNFQGVQGISLSEKKVVFATALPPAAIFDMVYSEARQRLYVALGDGTLAVLRAPDWRVETLLRLSDKSLRCLALHEERGELAVGGSDWQLRLLDADSLAVRRQWEGGTNSIFTAAYSPDGRYLLTAGRDAHLRRWDLAADCTEQLSIVAHLFTINHLAFSPDGSLLATCSMDKSIKLWDAETLQLLRVLDKARHAGHGTSVNKLFWPGRQNRLVSCSDDRSLAVWQLTMSND